MKKKIIAMILAVMTAFTCMFSAACGGDNEGGNKDNPADVMKGAKNSGMVYDRYDLDTYIFPYWAGNTVYNETALFVGKTDASPLLYKASKILKVTSYDLKTEYKEGEDWTYDKENNLLRRTENSKMPYVERDDWFMPRLVAEDKKILSWPMKNDPDKYLFFKEGSYISNLQVAITYEHSEYADGEAVEPYTEWGLPQTYTEVFKGLREKLENNQPVKLGYLGDSVTFGAIASGMPGSSFEPYAEIYAKMMTSFMSKRFKNDNVTYINPSVGGMKTSWGISEANANEDLHDLDFCVIAFGLNDIHVQTDNCIAYAAQILSIIDTLTGYNGNIPILVVAPMLGNPDCTVYHDETNQMDALHIMLDDDPDYANVGIAEVSKMHQQVYHRKNKRYQDITSNNINHPNDFAERIYTMTCLTAMFGYDYFKIGLEQTETNI